MILSYFAQTDLKTEVIISAYIGNTARMMKASQNY